MTKEGDYIVKRKTYLFRKKNIIEVEEYHDGRYGSPGRKRQPRAKPTPEYTKRGPELRWIRNIQQGTKGAWHIHLVVNEIGDTTSIIKRVWEKGGIYAEQIRLSDKIYDEDFSKLAAYMTKDENTTEEKADGTMSKPRIRQSSYSTSRNMPLPEPKVDKLMHWKREPKPKKGYEIVRIYEGINPVTSYSYRRYTMRRRE